MSNREREIALIAASLGWWLRSVDWHDLTPFEYEDERYYYTFERLLPDGQIQTLRITKEMVSQAYPGVPVIERALAGANFKYIMDQATARRTGQTPPVSPSEPS